MEGGAEEGRDDVTQAMESPPPEEHTRPEVHLPVDVPPEDLTELHATYESGDESSASLPLEAPFGAHRAPEPEATTLPIERWLPPSSTSPGSSVTRMRTRTIAVEEDVNSGWSTPPPPAPQPIAPPRATASTPPSVVVSPSMVPSQPSMLAPMASQASWTMPPPSSHGGGAPPPSSPPLVSYPPAAQGSPSGPRLGMHGTVEMNLQVSHGLPSAMSPAVMSAPPPQQPPSPAKVSALVWAMIVLSALAVVGMMAFAQLRGARP